jgi:hypothetical protein
MDFRDFFLTQHARVHAPEVGGPDLSVQDYLLNNLTDEQMRERPQPGFNSLAWLFWHMTRGEDMGMNLVIAGSPQVLDEGGWVERLGVSNRDVATGMTDQEVDEFSQQVDIQALLGYRAAVGKRTRVIVRELRPEVLEETIDEGLIQRVREAGAYGPNTEWVPKRWLGKSKSFTLLYTVLGHTYIHIGQCEDIRSLLGLNTL